MYYNNVHVLRVGVLQRWYVQQRRIRHNVMLIIDDIIRLYGPIALDPLVNYTMYNDTHY